jgi:hypothetical protein
MNQLPIPTYLPAVNRQLEYQAGLLTSSSQTDAKIAVGPTSTKPWLGTDFTDIIVTR